MQKLKDTDLSFLGCVTCQVRNSLYAYYTKDEHGCFKRFDFLATVGKKVLKFGHVPGEKVASPSLANYDNRYLYLSGGNNYATSERVSCKKVHRFDIMKSKWTEAPDLNRARY